MTGEGETWVRFGDLVESPVNEREIGDISSFAETIDPDPSEFKSVLRVWDRDGEYEIIDGHRRYRALEYHGVDDDHVVPANITEHDSRREALLDNIQSDENREDLTPMEQARKWGRYVLVECDGEEISYLEYVNSISERVPKDNLHIPTADHPSVQELSSKIDLGPKSVYNRLSYLLYSESVQEDIEKGFLKQTVARTIPSRCTSVDDPEKGMELIAALGEHFKGQGGIDSEKRDIINWSIDHTNETGEVAVITEEPPEPEPEPEESEEPEQEERDEPEQEQDEPEESEGSSEDERIEAVLTDLYNVESEGEKGFVDGILGYIDAYDLTADDVESARENRDSDSEESFMNQLHIRAGNVNRIHSGPEYDEIHGSDEPEEEQEGNEEQNRGTSESTESGSDDEPEWSDSVSSSDGEDTSPEDSVEEAETDSSDDSEESEGESDTEYTPVVQERSMDSTEDSDEELPDTMDPVDILNQPTDEKVRQKAKEAGYETPDDLVEDMYNIEFGSDGKSQTMREAMGEEAFQDFVEFKMDTQQVHREWNEDPLISKVQSHYKSFRNLRDVFEQTPDDMSCPCCGSGTTKLEWSCCGVELGESLERHAEEAEENKSEALERMGQIEDEVRNGVEVESEVNDE